MKRELAIQCKIGDGFNVVKKAQATRQKLQQRRALEIPSRGRSILC